MRQLIIGLVIGGFVGYLIGDELRHQWHAEKMRSDVLSMQAKILGFEVLLREEREKPLPSKAQVIVLEALMSMEKIRLGTAN